MNGAGLLLLPLTLAACAGLPEPADLAPPAERLDCYRLPSDRWGDCLERARRMDFNVYECERRALQLGLPTERSGEIAGE